MQAGARDLRAVPKNRDSVARQRAPGFPPPGRERGISSGPAPLLGYEFNKLGDIDHYLKNPYQGGAGGPAPPRFIFFPTPSKPTVVASLSRTAPCPRANAVRTCTFSPSARARHKSFPGQTPPFRRPIR